jgi:hypothetical protein
LFSAKEQKLIEEHQSALFSIAEAKDAELARVSTSKDAEI